MDLQAVRYAAMVSNMILRQAVDTYQDYLEKRANEPGSDPVEEDAAETRRGGETGLSSSSTPAHSSRENSGNFRVQ